VLMPLILIGGVAVQKKEARADTRRFVHAGYTLTISSLTLRPSSLAARERVPSVTLGFSGSSRRRSWAHRRTTHAAVERGDQTSPVAAPMPMPMPMPCPNGGRISSCAKSGPHSSAAASVSSTCPNLSRLAV